MAKGKRSLVGHIKTNFVMRQGGELHIVEPPKVILPEHGEGGSYHWRNAVFLSEPPPSVNTSTVPVAAKGGGLRKISSAGYRRWQENVSVEWAVNPRSKGFEIDETSKLWLDASSEVPYSAQCARSGRYIAVYFINRHSCTRNSDIMNREKAITDLVVARGGIPDDKYIHHCSLTWDYGRYTSRAWPVTGFIGAVNGPPRGG